MGVGIHPLSFSKISDASQWIISRNGLDTTTALSDYLAKIGELPAWCHSQGMSPVLHSPHGFTWAALADIWLFQSGLWGFSQLTCKWHTGDLQQSKTKHPVPSMCLPMHPSLQVPVGTYCCDSQNGKACGDAVHTKVVLIYAPLFCNHKAWSNTMPTKSALFASLYGYSIWQIFNSCNLPETSNLEGKLR